MSAALEDLRVIDVGHVLAGPFAATLLGDLGADVIKIEPPDGDGLRRLGPRKDDPDFQRWFGTAIAKVATAEAAARRRGRGSNWASVPT